MSDCCSTTDCSASQTQKHRCPVNGVAYREVPSKTISHHIARPWQWDDRGHAYYFCEDPECDVVYFSDDEEVILQSQLRTCVGKKSRSADAPICYCFGVSKADAMADVAIKAFVIEQTKLKNCTCDTSNPSGRCCLKDFPRE